MSAWIVYSKDGKTERCRLKALEYSGSFMADRAVTATFEHHSEVAFEVFDYIVYRGEKFELESVPSVKKTSSDRYEYELRFVSLKYELERCEMRDIVPNDNGVVYPTPLTFSFTGDVRYLAERIQVNLDALYGEGVWHISVAENTTSEEKNITIGQQNCWNALSLVNTTYGLNFSVRGREVLIGGELDSVNHEFQYGKGNGLYEIERASDTETGIVTKLRAYGGTRNLDYSYPKKPEWADSVLPVSFALSPLRLMLPSFKEDGKTDFVLADEATIAKYGIRESSIIYEDIYPSITGATNANGEAIDEIVGVDEIDETKNTFTVYLRNLGFDLNEHLTTSEAQISMKTGTLQGYTFTITAIELLGDGRYKLTLGRNSLENSEESGAYVPSKNWNMRVGDKFVLLNILMPQAYIREAEQRLLARAKEYLAEYGKTNFSYNVGLHDKFLVEHTSVYESLIEGVKLNVYDAELGISEHVTIQSITITEDASDNILPQVKVTLNNKPSASTLDRIQGKLNDVIAETSANSFSSQSELMKQYRKKLDKPFFDKLFSAVDADGNEIASNDVSTPVAYIKAKYDFMVLGGVTMYGNDESLDLPTLAEGLPFDQRTIWFNPETKQIEVIGGTGGGEGGVSNFWDLSGIPSWITSTKPTYSYSEILGTPDLSGYATTSALNAVSTKLNDFLEGSDTDTVINKWKELETFLSGLTESDNLATILTGKADKSYVDTNFVTIAGTEDVTGLHNFVNGLKVGGIELIQKNGNAFLKGNLVVEGGITMYGDGEGGSSIPSYSTLGSLLNVDESNDAVASVDRVLFQSAGSNVWSWKALSEIGGGGSVSGDYLPLSGGILTGNLTLGNSSNTSHIGYYINRSGNTIGLAPDYNCACLRFATSTSKTNYLRLANGVLDLSYDGGTNWNNILHAGNISSYNAGSATKLQTARTIWGQSFDGTGNVSGDIYLNNSHFIRVADTSGTSRKILTLDDGNNVVLGYHTADASYDTYIDGLNIHIRSGKHNEVVHINSSGKVGIGTTSPEHKLHVYGTMRSYDVSTDKVSVTLNNSKGFSEYNALNYNMAWFANTQTLSVPYNSVQVALGWSNLLEGQGYHTRYSISSIRFGGWGGMSLAVGANDEGTYRGCTLELWGSGTISAGGNLTVSGGITMYSDIRKKTKLQDVELSLSQIADAPLIQHYYNSDQNKTTHVGSIAQYWAGLNDWFCKLDAEGFYTMEIQNCALASAISIARHLEKFETKTDKTIRKMKKRIQELEDEVERLKQN